MFLSKLLPSKFIFWLYTSKSRLAHLLLEQSGAAGDVKLTYAASASQTVTNLQGLVASATWVAGWESGAIDNSSNKYTDYAINAVIVVESAGLTAGEIRMYLVPELEDASWPDVFDGTESAETITDTEIRDAICFLAATTVTDTTASRTYYLLCPSASAVFGGSLPRKFVIFITQSTVAALETSGNAVYIRGVYPNVAQS